MNLKRYAGSLAATLTTVGALTLLAFASSGPALAAGVTVSISSPSAASPPPQGYQGALPISASATCGTLCSISSMSLVITDAASRTVGADSSGSSPISYSWNSAAVANGTYTIQVTAQGAAALGLMPSSGSASASAKINNAPSAPSGVASVLGSGGFPVVSWNANPEPDITGYEIFRSGSASSAASFTTAGNVTSFTDANAPTGVPLSYIVVAVRSSPIWSSGITSCGGQAPCSNPPTSAETSAVTVPVPVAPAAAPASVATADPPPGTAGSSTVSGTATSTATQPLIFTATKPTALVGPQSATTVVQQAEPKVVQFAPLLPYSGKIPELSVTSTVPAPVQAAGGAGATGSDTVALPGIGNVTPVDAIKYIATALFLIVVAFHVVKFARKLTRGM